MAALALVTWLCGAFLLPHAIKDAGIRWGIAATAGAVLAGFLALWGQSLAADGRRAASDGVDQREAAGQPARTVTGAGDVKVTFKGGTFHQQVSISRDAQTILQSLSPAKADGPLLADKPAGGDIDAAVVPGHDASRDLLIFGLPHRRDDFFPRAELQDLNTVLASVKTELRSKVVIVCGPSGFGKTTLVSQWAYHVLNQDESFFEACYFLDLRGFSRLPPITADVALDTILNLNSLTSAVPETTELRAHRFRTLAADQRMLLILDNVFDEEALEHLVPKAGCSLVIITTRQPGLLKFRKKTGIRSDLIDVKLLSPEDSKGLLRRALGSQVADHPESVEELVVACSGWPLRLGEAAAIVYSKRQTLAQVADAFGRRPTRSPESPEAFDTSLDLLSEDAKHVFRLLSLRRSQDIDKYSVALLAESNETAAATALKDLLSVALIRPDNDRYAMHDFFYDYARTRFAEDETPATEQAAFARLLRGYYGCVNYAFDWRNQRNPMVDAKYLAEWESADPAGKAAVERYDKPEQWFDAERANLVYLVQRASTMSPLPPWAPHLAFSMFYFLDVGRYWAEWELVTDLGYQMAEALDDAWVQARLLRNIARLKWVRVRDYSDTLRLDSSRNASSNRAELDQCEAALRVYEDSDRIYQEQELQHPEAAAAEHPREAATVRRELADVYLEQARLDHNVSFERAVRAYRDAEATFRRYEHWENPVASLSVPLSVAYRHLRRFDEAENCLKVALKNAGPPDERSRPRNVGTYCFALLRQAELQAERYLAQKGGRPTPEVVLGHYDEAAAAFRDHGYLLPEARTLVWKGKFLEKLGDFARAKAVWTEAHGFLISAEPNEGRVVQAWIEGLPEDDY